MRIRTVLLRNKVLFLNSVPIYYLQYLLLTVILSSCDFDEISLHIIWLQIYPLDIYYKYTSLFILFLSLINKASQYVNIAMLRIKHR